MHNVITDSVSRGGCQEGWREVVEEEEEGARKKKVSAKIKKCHKMK